MFSGTTTTTRRRRRMPAPDSAAGKVLADLKTDQQTMDAAEAAKLAHVLAWCELHITTDPRSGETWGDVPVQLGGQGCPWIREFTITELASTLRLSLPAARSLVSDVLELAFRLPRLWARVQAGEVRAWRARRVADQTQSLSLEAASFVDAQVAGFADTMGATAVERLVEDAVARFMPDLAQTEREAAAEQRRFTIDRDHVSFAGTSSIEGVLDLADAIDLDTAIAQIATQLKDLGYGDLSLDARRAMAAGVLARDHLGLPPTQPPIPLDDLQPRAVDETPAVAPNEDPDRASQRPVGARGRRDLMLYLHLSADDVLSLEGHGNPVLAPQTLREWLDIPDHTHLTVRPVVDLNCDLTSSGRFASDLQREQITLRDRTCAAPFCERPARHLDLDHITEFDDTGPPGQTRSTNLAPLCRHHHRAKTFTTWDCQQLLPGVFLWEAPHGLHYLTYAGRTIDLN